MCDNILSVWIRSNVSLSVLGLYQWIPKMWAYRELIRNLTVAELKNRYQSTTLGFFWSILSPLLLALVLYFVFRNIFNQEDFAIKLLVGLTAWRFFVNGTNSSLYSVVARANLVTKVYIPRKILVISTVLANLVSSTLEFSILLPIIFILADVPFTIPLFILVNLVFFWFILGVGYSLGAIFVYFRDINQVWEVLTTALFFLCPIVYPLSIISEAHMFYYMLNPITRFITVYRDVMVTGNLPSIETLVIIVIASIVMFIIGDFIFNKLQRRFAEAL
jgi:lipopolysaccharide transport system permease protein